MIVDLKNIISKYQNERRLGIIIFGEANSGKTNYIKNFINKTKKYNGLYLNIEDEFLINKKNEDIFSLITEKYLKWIKELTKLKNITFDYFVIDEMDFLFNFWDDNKKTEFIKRVQLMEVTEYLKPVIFILQDDELIYSELKKEKKAIEENQTLISHIFKFKNLKNI